MSLGSVLKFHPVVLLFVGFMFVMSYLVRHSNLDVWSKMLMLVLIFSLQVLAVTFEIQRTEEVQKVV